MSQCDELRTAAVWLGQQGQANLSATVIRAVEELAELRAHVEALHRERKGEVWYWQGDAYDAPESLSCPVLMEAETLRLLWRKAEAYIALLTVARAAKAVLESMWEGKLPHARAVEKLQELLAQLEVQARLKEASNA